MYATHRTKVIHSRAKHSITMSKDKKNCGRNTEHKPYIFFLKCKGQRRIGIMNVRDTSSHVPSANYGKQMSNQQKRTLWAGHESLD